ncbi:MAG: PilW family protein [Candidatus Omnitrophota bacterium]
MKLHKLNTSIKGFSLVELQVAIIVAVILILAVVGISQIGNQNYTRLRKESDIYSDLGYGLKMVRNKVRESSTVYVNHLPGDGWVNGQYLVVDNGAFGLYKHKDQNDVEFVYVKNIGDIDNSEKRIKLFVTESGKDENLIRFSELNDVVTITEIEGRKDGVDFDLPDVVIKRRAS